MPLPSGRYRLRRLTPCAWPDAADPPARSCAAVLALAARPTFPRVGTTSGLPQSMHSPISHHRAASACMRGVRLGVAREPCRLHRALVLVMLATDTSVCSAGIAGIRHRRSDRAIFKPDRRPLMRFSSLSALAGPRRAGRGCRVPADAASWLQVAACSTLRLSALRVALGSVRHVTTVKCSPRCSTVLPHWPPLWEKRPLNARRRHQSCGRFVVISRRRLANHVGLSQDRVCRPWSIIHRGPFSARRSAIDRSGPARPGRTCGLRLHVRRRS